jgi:hypothetical protein
MKFTEDELMNEELALKERAVRVLHRRWAPKTKTQPFAKISIEKANSNNEQPKRFTMSTSYV